MTKSGKYYKGSEWNGKRKYEIPIPFDFFYLIFIESETGKKIEVTFYIIRN